MTITVTKTRNKIKKNYFFIENRWIGDYELNLYSTPNSSYTNDYYVVIAKRDRKNGGFHRKKATYKIKGNRSSVLNFFIQSTLLDYL